MSFFLYLCAMKIAIIGAGAAGCFCANLLKESSPQLQIDLYESGQKPLQKVAITGGGRCNLTNSFAEVRSLQQVYPRGTNLMKRLLKQFGHQETMRWWENHGVRLVVQEDQCVFPQSQDAMQIVETLQRGMRGSRLYCQQRVTDIEPIGTDEKPAFRVFTDNHCEIYDRVVVTTGGSPKASMLNFLSSLELEMVEPVPSLFTFNIPGTVTEMMGIVVEHVTASLTSTKFKAEGPLLITHWGMSGPAILKLSSHAARWLAERDYKASLSVNWMGSKCEDEIHEMLEALLAQNPKKQIGSVRPKAETDASSSPLTQRLWSFLLSRADINAERRCAEIGSKQLNRLAATLTNDIYPVAGQSRFKEEFVTCGGVALSNIDPNTMECRKHKGLYLAGEVLDVDAVTGGFNLQAAWSMGHAVATAIEASFHE